MNTTPLRLENDRSTRNPITTLARQYSDVQQHASAALWKTIHMALLVSGVILGTVQICHHQFMSSDRVVMIWPTLVIIFIGVAVALHHKFDEGAHKSFFLVCSGLAIATPAAVIVYKATISHAGFPMDSLVSFLAIFLAFIGGLGIYLKR